MYFFKPFKLKKGGKKACLVKLSWESILTIKFTRKKLPEDWQIPSQSLNQANKIFLIKCLYSLKDVSKKNQVDIRVDKIYNKNGILPNKI